MIRIVEPEELESLAALGREFYFDLNLPGRFCDAVFVDYWKRLIVSGAGFIIARFSENKAVEAIGAVVYPDMQTGELSSCTTFWYYQPQAGLATGLLSEALHAHWKMIQVVHGFVSVLCNERFDKVSGFLVRSGYRLAEMQFRKAI